MNTVSLERTRKGSGLLVAVLLLAGLCAVVATPGAASASYATGLQEKCSIFGTEKDDWIMGTSGDDVICAGAGDDVIVTLGGTDVVRTGSGADIVQTFENDVVIQDHDPAADVVVGESGAIDQLGRSIDAKPGRASQFVSDRINELHVAPAERSLIDAAPPAPPPVRPSRGEIDRALESRSALDFDILQSKDEKATVEEAISNGSITRFGAALSDQELATMDRRYRAGDLLGETKAATEALGLRNGKFVSPSGDAVLNATAEQISEIGTQELGGLILREVDVDRAQIEAEVEASTELLVALVPELKDRMEWAFRPRQYEYRLSFADGVEVDAEEVHSVLGRFPHVADEFVTFTEMSDNHECDERDCYSFMPGMKIDTCTAGWLVNHGGTTRMFTSGHCDNIDRVIKVDAPSSREIDLRYVGGTEEHDWPQGFDHQLMNVLESTRSGDARLNGMNAVNVDSANHSLLVGSPTTSEAGMPVCRAGQTSQRLGLGISCGSISSLGILGGGYATGLVEVDGAFGCGGDSGGPVWNQASTAVPNRAVGIAARRYGTVDPTHSACRESFAYADLNRAMAAEGATFFNPNGDESSRRATIRYYDLLFDREPDGAGWSAYDAFCNTDYMVNLAYVFTNSQNTELYNRFNLSTVSGTTGLVDHIYWSLFDRDRDAYWFDFIYGNSSDSAADRRARAEYFTWVALTDPGASVEFKQSRMNQIGPNGAPPMCQATTWEV